MDSLLFVSAQPDVPYFHWQVKLYVHNFIEKGINPNDPVYMRVLGQAIDKPFEELKNWWNKIWK